jgi:hypothetical protein
VTTVRDHASRHNWAKQPFQSRKQRDAWAGRGRGAAALAAGEVTTPDLAELEALTRPEDQIAWLGDYLVRALAKLIASANAGVLDKVEMDALTSLMRLLEPAKILAVAPENEKGNQIDDDADVCGLVFGGTARLKIATELGIARTIGSIELMLMGSAVASLCAWWAMGFLARAFERGGWVWSKERRESDER